MVKIMQKIAKKALFLCLVLALAVSALSACGKKTPVSLELVPPAEAGYYCVGDTFDSKGVSAEGKEYSRIPQVYAVYENGKRSKDLSKSGKVTFSGYDLSQEGEYTVTAEYRGVKAEYGITVINKTVLFIEAEDPFRSTVGCFRVGEPFTTYYLTEDGVERGVTVWVHYESELEPQVGYFSNAPELAEAVFDTSECGLDENGRFTKAGVFTVRVTLGEMTTGYQITVKD